MRKPPVALTAVSLLAVAVVLVGGLGLVHAGKVTVPGAVPVAELPVESQMRACSVLQGGVDAPVVAATDCLKSVLVQAVRDDRYDSVSALQASLVGMQLFGACHSAGHLAGVDLVAEFGVGPTIDRMFHGLPLEAKDITCTTGVVHGLVQGATLGEPPYDLAALAGHCVSLEAVNPSYANECSHYFGHAVWRSVGAIDSRLGIECSRLGAGSRSRADVACVGGAIMEKFDLQSGSYDPTGQRGNLLEPPEYGEAAALCDALVDSPESIVEGCWGGVGWLLAMRSRRELSSLDTGTPAGRESALGEYQDAVSYCANAECAANFIDHMRYEDFENGIAAGVCADPGTAPRIERVRLDDMCASALMAHTPPAL